MKSVSVLSPKEDGSIAMENGVIAVCLDRMGHLTSLQLVDSERYAYHPVTGTGLLKPL